MLKSKVRRTSNNSPETCGTKKSFSAEGLFVSLSTEEKGAFLMCYKSAIPQKQKLPLGQIFGSFKSKYNLF